LTDTLVIIVIVLVIVAFATIAVAIAEGFRSRWANIQGDLDEMERQIENVEVLYQEIETRLRAVESSKWIKEYLDFVKKE
jgi:F0F1-type ATP synthase membrane subunit b/b'